MEFELPAEATEAAGLAASILTDHCTPDRLKSADAGRFDQALWKQLGESGLLSLCVPEEYDGSGLGLLELCAVLVEAGRTVAPVPLGSHTVTALAMAEHGSEEQRSAWLPAAASGGSILTTAIAEERQYAPPQPATRAEADAGGWHLFGTKVAVAAGTRADLFVVPATSEQGLTVFLVHPDDAGVEVVEQRLTGGETSARLVLEGASLPADRVLGDVGEGRLVVDWLTQRLTVALCAQQLGTLEGALELTSAYAKTREQFGRPIGTFQAVSQRLADGYIDVLGARLTMWQAAWRLSEGLSAAQEVSVAKVWAADAGHRVAHTTVHVHGGVGIDLDGEAHRYFTTAKRQELTLGGTTDQSREIGRRMAQAAS